MKSDTMGKLLQRYGAFGLASLSIDVLYTRLFFPRARLVRRPIYIRGSRYIDFGVGLTTGRLCRIDAMPAQGGSKPILRFGRNVQINDFVHIGAIQSVTIQDNVLIASRVFISDHNHGCYSGSSTHSQPESAPIERTLSSIPVVIEKNVWIGESVSILPGVTIGKGSIIGAESVVSKSIPSFCIAAGVPARVLKLYNFMSEKWERA
jgi:acetyltransferase-like isoleucine patch superfamily enzyme